MAHITQGPTFAEQQAVQANVYKKHLADIADGGSVLTPYLSKRKIDFLADLTAGTNTASNDGNRIRFKAESEAQTTLRNNTSAPIWKISLEWVQFLQIF
jgi:hypothetical protein